MERDERVPSQTFEGEWIYANSEQNNYHVKRGRSGKWLIFEYKDEIDETWNKIKKATREGIFGTRSKDATARPSPKASNNNFRVICIYTADFDNTADINRIAKSIRSLGIENKLIYKLNNNIVQRELNDKFRYSESYYKTVKWLTETPNNKYIQLKGINRSGKNRFLFQRLDLEPNQFKSKILTLAKFGFFIEDFDKLENGKITFSE